MADRSCARQGRLVPCPAKRRWKFCVIGGLAVQRWGEPRLTRVADLTLLTGFGQEGKYIDALLGPFSPRFEGAREFAQANRVLLLSAAVERPDMLARVRRVLEGRPWRE